MAKLRPCKYSKIFTTLQESVIKGVSSDTPCTEADALDAYILEHSDIIERVYVDDVPFMYLKNGNAYTEDIYICNLRNNLSGYMESSIVDSQKHYKLPEYLKKMGYKYGTSVPESLCEQSTDTEIVQESQTIKLGRNKYKSMTSNQLKSIGEKLMGDDNSDVARFGETLKDSASQDFGNIRYYLSNVALILFVGGETLDKCLPYIIASVVLMNDIVPESILIPELKNHRNTIRSKLKPKDSNLVLYTDFIYSVIKNEVKIVNESYELPSELESLMEARRSRYNENFGKRNGPTDYDDMADQEDEPEEDVDDDIEDDEDVDIGEPTDYDTEDDETEDTEDNQDDNEEDGDQEDNEEQEEVEQEDTNTEDDNTGEEDTENNQNDQDGEEDQQDDQNDETDQGNGTEDQDNTDEQVNDEQPENNQENKEETDEPEEDVTQPTDYTDDAGDDTETTDTNTDTDNTETDDNNLDNNEDSQQDGNDGGLDDGPTDYDDTASTSDDTTDDTESTPDDSEEGTDGESGGDEESTDEDSENDESGEDRDSAVKNYNIRLKFKKLAEALSDILENLSSIIYHNPVQNQVLERGITNIQNIKNQILSYMEFNISSDYKTNLYYYTTFIQALQLNLDMLTKNSKMDSSKLSYKDTKNNK